MPANGGEDLPNALGKLCREPQIKQEFTVDRGNRWKLNPNGEKSLFIGYYEESIAYLPIDLEAR